MHTLELKIPPVVVMLTLAALAWGAARVTPGLRIAVPASAWIAGGLAISGVVVALLGVAAFRRAQTTVNPLHPNQASRLVADGIYRRTRNPMYLGMLLVLLGWAVLLSHPLALAAAAAFVPLMNRLQIAPEERILAGLFAADFDDYRAKVRRWI